VAHPLTTLTNKTTDFVWRSKQQAAFAALKQSLLTSPLLDYPRKDDKFVLATDASELEAVLSTKRGSVIEYASRTLKGTIL